MSGDSSERSLQKLRSVGQKLDAFAKPLQVLAGYLTMFAAIWILAALVVDVPAPSVVEVADEHPDAMLFAMAALLLIYSRDATKWYKHKMGAEL